MELPALCSPGTAEREGEGEEEESLGVRAPWGAEQEPWPAKEVGARSWWGLGLATCVRASCATREKKKEKFDTKHSQGLPPVSLLAWGKRAGTRTSRVAPWLMTTWSWCSVCSVIPPPACTPWGPPGSWCWERWDSNRSRVTTQPLFIKLSPTFPTPGLGVWVCTDPGLVSSSREKISKQLMSFAL